MDALTKALNDVERMRMNFATKAASSPSVTNVVASGQALGMVRPSVGTATEQLSHFKGWVWAAVRLIATRIAGQSIYVAREAKRPKPGKHLGEALQPLDSHSLLDALADPSELHTEWSLKFVTVASLELTVREMPSTSNDLGDPFKNIRAQNNAIQTINGQSHIAATRESFMLFEGQFHVRILSRGESTGKANHQEDQLFGFGNDMLLAASITQNRRGVFAATSFPIASNNGRASVTPAKPLSTARRSS